MTATLTAPSTASVPSIRDIGSRVLSAVGRRDRTASAAPLAADHVGACVGHVPASHLDAAAAVARSRAIDAWVTAFHRDHPEFDPS